MATAVEYNTDEFIFVKDVIGVEDLLLGLGATQQVRDGEFVSVTRINAESIPYRKPDGTVTNVKAVLDELLSLQGAQ